MPGKMGKSDSFNKNCYNGYYTFTAHLEPKMKFSTPDEVEKFVKNYELWVRDVLELYEEFKRDYENNKETLVREVEEYKKILIQHTN